MKAIYKKTLSLIIAVIFVIPAFSAFALEDGENLQKDVFQETEANATDENIEINDNDESDTVAFKNSLFQTNSLSADFTAFDSAYSNAFDFLCSLATPAPLYFASDVNALITLVNSSEVQKYANQSDEERSGYISGGEEETEANQLAQSLNAQVASVKECSGTLDVSSYKQIVSVMQNVEQDAYDYAPESVVSDLSSKTKLITSSYSFNSLTIKAINQNKTQNLVDAVVNSLQSKLTTNIRKYTVEIVEGSVSNNAGVTFLNGKNEYDSTTGIYKFTYNTSVFFKADSESAWYISIDSPSISRSVQYQASGETFSTNIIGNIRVYIKNSTNKHKVTLCRKYSDNNNTPIALTTYVSDSYTLPEASAFPFYSFSDYSVGDNHYQAGETVEISSDTKIYANYVKNETLSCSINVIDGTGISATYNQRVSLNGDSNTYAWLVLDKITNLFKPFYIGKDVVFYASEPMTLKKVTQEEFNSSNYSLPAINIRQDGAFSKETDGVKKVYFNGQVVNDDVYEIAECGIILGKAKEGGSITAEDVILENIDSSEQYSLHRFKSTKSVGANQFSIGVKNLSGDVIYKGYVTYRIHTNQFLTVYTEAISQSL